MKSRDEMRGVLRVEMRFKKGPFGKTKKPGCSDRLLKVTKESNRDQGHKKLLGTVLELRQF